MSSARGSRPPGLPLLLAPSLGLIALGLAGGAGAGAGCGEVHFVVSPYTPQAVEVIYSDQEDVTVVRWRVAAAAPPDGTRFEIRADVVGAGSGGGFVPVDFGASYFPGGVAPCRDVQGGSCAQLVLDGKRDVAPGTRVVRAWNDTFGLHNGLPATVRTEAETLAVSGFFAERNHTVETRIADKLADDGPYRFARPYQRALWPTGGLCVRGAIPAATEFAAYGGTRFDAPATLSDDGSYCVAARSTGRDGRAGADAQARILTLPETTIAEATYQPPIETSPVIYQIVVDVEIPVPDRCTGVSALIDSVFASALGAVDAPIHVLPTVNLTAGGGAASCHQADGRTIDGAAMALAVKDLVAGLPERHQRYHVVYVNNLASPIPSTLDESFTGLVAGLRGPGDLQPITWAVGPRGSDDFPWMRNTVLLSPHDERFATEIARMADEQLPLDSEIHDADQPVPLLSADETARRAGGWIKICRSAPAVAPSRGLVAVPAGQGFTIAVDAPPGYRVELPPRIAVPRKLLQRNKVDVRYEICSRYCEGHPYRDEGNGERASWSTEAECVGGTP